MEGLTLVPSATALPLLAAAIVILLLGSVGLARDRVSAVTISFAMLAGFASWWLASVSIVMMTTRPDFALAWSRIVYLGVSFLPAASVQFALALSERLRERRWIVLATWVTSGVFAVLFATTDLFLDGVDHYRWGYYPRLSGTSAAFVGFVALGIGWSALALWSAITTSLAGQQKARAAWFLAALAIGDLGAVDFLPSFGIDIVPVGYIAVSGFTVLSLLTILRYRFADLSPAFVAEQLLETVHGGVLVVDLHGVIQLANPAAAAMLGRSEEPLDGVNLHSILRTNRLPMTESASFARVGRARNRAMTLRREDGERLEVSVSATLLRDRDALPVGILYVLQDLADRRRAERHEFAANHDALTGVPNRTYFAQRFPQSLAEIERQRRTAAVLFVDLDGFKRVNDEHGHTVGDRLLQLVASRLSNALRSDDILSRYGGDEFVVLLNLRNTADARIVADKLMRVFREPFSVDSLTLQIGASIGVSIAPRDGTEMDELIRAADKAMYREKRERTPARRPASDSVAPSPFGAESRA